MLAWLRLASVCCKFPRASGLKILLTLLITRFNESREFRTLFSVGVNCAFTSSNIPLSVLVSNVSPGFRKMLSFPFSMIRKDAPTRGLDIYAFESLGNIYFYGQVDGGNDPIHTFILCNQGIYFSNNPSIDLYFV